MLFSSAAVAHLTGSIRPTAQHWIRLFFFMLFLLGLDSAFSFMEGFLTVLQDAKFFRNVDRRVLSLAIALVAFLLSLMYATDAGLIFLDVIDYYINFVMILVGGFECFAAGWVYGIEGQVRSLGAGVVSAFMATTFGSVILACALWFGLSNADDAVWAGFVGLVVSYVIGLAFVFCLMRKRKQTSPDLTWKGMCYDLFLKNIMDLRDDLAKVAGFTPRICHYSTVWALLIKYFIPPILIILFSLDADTNLKDSDGNIVFDAKGNPVKKFGHYVGYVTRPYQVLGILTVVFAGFLFVSSLIFPGMYAWLQKEAEPDEVKFKGSSSNADVPAEDFEEGVAAKNENPLKEEATANEEMGSKEDKEPN